MKYTRTHPHTQRERERDIHYTLTKSSVYFLGAYFNFCTVYVLFVYVA